MLISYSWYIFVIFYYCNVAHFTLYRTHMSTYYTLVFPKDLIVARESAAVWCIVVVFVDRVIQQQNNSNPISYFVPYFSLSSNSFLFHFHSLRLHSDCTSRYYPKTEIKWIQLASRWKHRKKRRKTSAIQWCCLFFVPCLFI